MPLTDTDPQATAADADAYPRLTLAQLLAGYDRTVHRSGFPDDGPVGKESI
jgi:hypothetical protein